MNERSFIMEVMMTSQGDLPRGERTRQRILNAAQDLFTRQGYHGTSMRQIANKAGLAVAGVYNHFASKEEVFVAVFHANHPIHEFIPALEKFNSEDVEAFIAEAVELMTGALEKRPQFLNLLFIEVVEFSNIHVGDIFMDVYPTIIAVVQRVQAKNRDRLKPYPLPILARMFMAVFFSYYLSEVLFAPKAPLDFKQNAKQYFLDVFLRGILQQP
ncbi:MAG: TetR/AcrR family transcriptional regulator [Anaerolineales bacterium]|nr:TetR/AcrR family transcriptional regulator [Anaerolineales bacterium]